MTNSSNFPVRKITIPALAGLVLLVGLVATSAAAATTYVGGQHGYTVKMTTSQGKLKLRKDQVNQDQGPSWEVDCGKSPKRRTLMFAVVPLTSGQRVLHGPIAHPPAKLRSCVVTRDGQIVATFKTHPA